MNATQLVKENNKLREDLNPENKRFYEDLMVTVRVHSLFRDNQQTEEALLLVLQDVLQAQESGGSAEGYLGKDASTLASEMIREISYLSKGKMLLYGLIGLGVYLYAAIGPSTIFDLVFSKSHQASLSLLTLLVETIVTVILVYGLLTSTRVNKFILKLSHQSHLKNWFSLILPISLLLATYLLIIWLTQNIWIVTF